MRYVRQTLVFIACLIILSCDDSNEGSSDDVGQLGSMTRFVIQNDYLYTVDDVRLSVFAVGPNTFTKVSQQEIGFAIETIFAKGEYLYMGAADGMYIYNISDPEFPSFVFRYTHIYSCDPVVVQGNRAYVTLRSGVIDCVRTGENVLEIVDISVKTNPVLIKRYNLRSPYGLGVDGNMLFVAEGENGLSIYDISDELQMKLVKRLSTLHAYDVICGNGKLIVTGNDGLFQYQYPSGDAEFVEYVSKIPVQKD